MSRRTQVVCDGCGKQKQGANHWWVVAIPQDQRVNETTVLSPPFELRLWPFGGAWPVPERWEFHDFCGQDCALKFISEQMGKVNQ